MTTMTTDALPFLSGKGWGRVKRPAARTDPLNAALKRLLATRRPFAMLRLSVALFAFIAIGYGPVAAAAQPLQVATFQVDATPPLGSPLCDGAVEPAKEIVDPLSARGIILLSDDKPIVLCVVDWVGIGNGGHDAWRKELAQAAETTVDRVSVHVVHQHDAPGCDFDAAAIAATEGLGGKLFDERFAHDVIKRAATAVAESLKHPQTVTHLGLGSAVVEKVASNRRILGPDGKVKIVRYSSSTDPEAIAAPEGVIDPKLRLVSFWDENRALVSMTFYATHPQSYYGHGGVSCDFVGIAREMRERQLPDVAHIHFNGAGGNVAAGKYNNGSPEVRPVLARRLAAAMKAAWDSTKKFPISAADIVWTFRPVALPLRDMYANEQPLLAQIKSKSVPMRYRLGSASDLAYSRLVKAGRQMNIGCLRVGPARLLFMPGELFVEYQLAAQAMRPDDFVAMAAYGDYGPGYIGTKAAYPQGGYETGPPSRTAPEVEDVLMEAMRQLLKE